MNVNISMIMIGLGIVLMAASLVASTQPQHGKVFNPSSYDFSSQVTYEVNKHLKCGHCENFYTQRGCKILDYTGPRPASTEQYCNIYYIKSFHSPTSYYCDNQYGEFVCYGGMKNPPGMICTQCHES
ncbi:hypothetical protein PGT21_017414 [Puccinia graminis f. sp. tritici]|uniref:Secreted protein n=1 Tax=Puccinia graminis f. sp. tritici TaxID=56615 RepID=A0A5B0P2N4_PUCGR|nr:hypothetical protein PGT21_017414 [Puccinia graminis f. sp. tritici]